MVRWRKAKRNGRPFPKTLMGQFIRASALRLDADTIRPLAAELRRTGEINSPVLIDVLFRIAVRRLFSTDYNIRRIGLFAEEVREAYGDAVNPRFIERLVRREVGQKVEIDDIDHDAAVTAKTLTFMRIHDIVHADGHDTERHLAAVIVEAENELEKERNMKPPGR